MSGALSPHDRRKGAEILHGIIGGGEGYALKRLRVPFYKNLLVAPLEPEQYLWSGASGCFYFGISGDEVFREYLGAYGDFLDRCRKCGNRHAGSEDIGLDEIRLCVECRAVICTFCQPYSETCGWRCNPKKRGDNRGFKVYDTCGTTYCARCASDSPFFCCGWDDSHDEWDDEYHVFCEACLLELPAKIDGDSCANCIKLVFDGVTDLARQEGVDSRQDEIDTKQAVIESQQEEMEAKQAVINSQQAEIEKLRNEIEALRMMGC